MDFRRFSSAVSELVWTTSVFLRMAAARRPQEFFELRAGLASQRAVMSSLAVARDQDPETVSFFRRRVGRGRCRELIHQRILVTMTKTIDAITEIVRNPKHAFRKADDRPAKAQKHRYERRKIKEYIKLSDWAQQAPA